MKIINNNKFWMILMVLLLALNIVFKIIGNNDNLNYIASVITSFGLGLWMGDLLNEKSE